MNDLYGLTLAKLGDLSREVHIDVLTEVRILVGFLRMSKGLTNSAN